MKIANAREIAVLMRALADRIELTCDEKAAEDWDKFPELKKPSVTLEQVRRMLAEKSRQGYAAEVRTLIRKYDAERLSDINPELFTDSITLQLPFRIRFHFIEPYALRATKVH